MVFKEQGDSSKQGPRREFELGRYTEDEAFMESGSGNNEAGAAAAGVIQIGT